MLLANSYEAKKINKMLFSYWLDTYYTITLELCRNSYDGKLQRVYIRQIHHLYDHQHLQKYI